MCHAGAGYAASLVTQALAAALTLGLTLEWDTATHRAWLYGMLGGM